MNFSFENKTVIITGAGRGIGKTTAISFAKAGANVMLASRTQSQLDSVEEEIRNFGGNVSSFLLDVKDKQACADLIDKTVEVFGGVNVIVHSGSDYYYKFVDDLTDEDIQVHFDSNTNAARWLLKAAAPYLSQTEDYGRFIAIGGIGGSVTSVAGMAAHCIAKSSLETFIKVAALEHGFTHKKILINTILPGMILSDRSIEMAGEETLLQASPFVVPLQRPGTTNEIADVCMFLASPGATYIHGASIVVDGGITLGGRGQLPFN